ncbi:hypothetical protein [Thalassospira sp. CH_XMU1448-2]|uniref:hypothetical protein n=1 Tax=Thalassospira sp. CH_XMU1448-2 TaxID=3107773 RepID=UPI00300B50A4
MSQDMRLKLTLRNESSQNPLHLSSLAPSSGWQTDPPHHLDIGDEATCEITTASELAITMRYGTHHIGLHLGNGAFSFEPGDARAEGQKLDGHTAELTLILA